MEPTAKLIGKRLLHPHDHEEDEEYRLHKKSARVASPSTTTDEERKEQMSGEADESQHHLSLQSLPEEVICTICSFLDVHSLLEMQCLNQSFRTIASKNSAGWSNLCDVLWKTKVHVSSAARLIVDSKMAAYRASLQDAKERHHIEQDEFLFDPITHTGTIWNFRFKEAAGTDWTAWDPWYLGLPCRQMVFLQDGTVKEYHPPPSLPPPLQHQDDDNSTATDVQGSSSRSPRRVGRLEVPSFSQRQRWGGGENLVDPPGTNPMRWRFVTQPMDMPNRPQGSYVRFTVAGRDVPTYVVRRSPTNNWGFIMESCWGLYASFPLPKRLPHRPRQRRHLRLRRAQDADGNWFNVAIEASDDEEGDDDDNDDEEENEAGQRSERQQEDEDDLENQRQSQLLDDRSLTVTSELHWREALMYNFGARTLPEGDDLSELERIDAMLGGILWRRYASTEIRNNPDRPTHGS